MSVNVANNLLVTNKLLVTNNVVVTNNVLVPRTQATPTFSPVAGTYSGTQSVTITSSGADNIYYTTDGSTPTTGSTLYSGPVSVAVSETLKAIAVKAGSNNSAVGTAAYVITAPPGFTFVNSVALDSSGVNPGTMDTTGATFLVAVISAASGVPTLSDSNNNTWNYLTTQTQANAVQSRIAYAFAPTVGAGHSFTIAGGAGKTAGVYAFKGGATTSACFVAQNGTVVNSASPQPGSVTPVANGLVITGIVGVLNNTSSATIDSGFTGLLKQFANLQAAEAYLLTANANPVNPTWTQGAGSVAAVIAAFQIA